jgi:hypothetical protein
MRRWWTSLIRLTPPFYCNPASFPLPLSLPTVLPFLSPDCYCIGKHCEETSRWERITPASPEACPCAWLSPGQSCFWRYPSSCIRGRLGSRRRLWSDHDCTFLLFRARGGRGWGAGGEKPRCVCMCCVCMCACVYVTLFSVLDDVVYVCAFVNAV